MAHEEVRGIISCELTPAGDGRTECKLRMEGTGNALCNAYEQITRELLKTLIDHDGKEGAMAIYAIMQMNALKAAGINPEEEVVKSKGRLEEVLEHLEERLEREARLRAIKDGLKDILGKTFTMPEQKEGETE